MWNVVRKTSHATSVKIWAGALFSTALLTFLISSPSAHDENHSLIGQWELSHHESDVLPVHAALLPDEGGKVLIMAGSGNDPNYVRGVNEVRLWDAGTEDVTGAPDFPGANVPAASSPTLNDNDVFCAAHVFLPDGKLFVAGGNLEYPSTHGAGTHRPHATPPNYDSPEARPACHDFLGLRDSFLYSPDTHKWNRGPKMERGRWYPSLLSLGNGRVFALSGLDDIGQGPLIPDSRLPTDFQGQGCRYPVLNAGAEIYTAATSSWSVRKIPNPSLGQVDPNNFGLYPYLHLLTTGKVFLAGPSAATEVFDADTLAREGAQKTSLRGGRDYGFSTLLALRPEEGYKDRVFNAGGGNGTGVTNQTEIIDFSAANPQWQAAAPMTRGRAQGASVLLPDGNVLVIGGTSGGDSNNNAILQAEMYNPVSNIWSSAGTAAIPRLYHSVALVLPDGRVFVAGSNAHDALDVNERAVETRIEVYSPPYKFRGAPPHVPNHPEIIGYGTPFTIGLGDATEVTEAAKVVLLRPGSTTHTRNFDQRLVELTHTTDPLATTGLIVTGPPNGNIAPPGDYMLFVINTKGVPSRGHFVRLQ